MESETYRGYQIATEPNGEGWRVWAQRTPELPITSHAQTPNDKRIVLHGPSIMLNPRDAEILALALHELVTKAAKHGALALEEGTLNGRRLAYQHP